MEIERYGAVVKLPEAAQQPRANSKLLVDLTKANDPARLSDAIEKVARYLNIYHGAGSKRADVNIAVVLHGDATLAVLNDDAYSVKFDVESNPNLDCLRRLHKAGVEIFVCGQSLAAKKVPNGDVVAFAKVAVSALTAIVNLQSDGYAYVPQLK